MYSVLLYTRHVAEPRAAPRIGSAGRDLTASVPLSIDQFPVGSHLPFHKLHLLCMWLRQQLTIQVSVLLLQVLLTL